MTQSRLTEVCEGLLKRRLLEVSFIFPGMDEELQPLGAAIYIKVSFDDIGVLVNQTKFEA